MPRSRSRSRERDRKSRRKHEERAADADRDRSSRHGHIAGDRSRSRSSSRPRTDARRRSRSRSRERRRRSRSRSRSRDRISWDSGLDTLSKLLSARPACAKELKELFCSFDDGESVVIDGIKDDLVRVGLHAFFASLPFRKEETSAGSRYRASSSLRRAGLYSHTRTVFKEAGRSLGVAAEPHETRTQAAVHSSTAVATSAASIGSRPSDHLSSGRTVHSAESSDAATGARTLGPQRPPPGFAAAAAAAAATSRASGAGAVADEDEEDVGPLLPGDPREEERRERAAAAAAAQAAEDAAEAAAEARAAAAAGRDVRDGRPEWLAGIASAAGMASRGGGEGGSRSSRACLGYSRTAAGGEGLAARLSEEERAAAAATGNVKLATAKVPGSAATGGSGGGAARPQSLMELHQAQQAKGGAGAAGGAGSSGAASRGVAAPGTAGYRPFDRERDLEIPRTRTIDPAKIANANGGLYARFR